MTCGILAGSEAASGSGGPRASRPPDCATSLLPPRLPAPGPPLPAICPHQQKACAPLRAPDGRRFSRLLLAGRWASGQSPGLGTHRLGHSGTNTGKRNPPLRQPLRPPSHDRDALLTFQFDLVQGASGPLHTTHSTARWAGGGHGEGDSGGGNDQSCQDIPSAHRVLGSRSVFNAN